MSRYGCALRAYDNGGRTADRYTIVPPRWCAQQFRRSGLWDALSCNHEPFHPQGIGMHCQAAVGKHLGQRVHWATLPTDVQRFARQNFHAWTPEED